MKEQIDKDTLDNNISEHFNGILSNLSNFKTQITGLQNQLKNLEKYVKKEFKNLSKEALKNKNKGNRKPSGFAKPTKISPELCEFLEKEDGAEVARTDVTQYLITYIQENELQDPENRKIIKPNDKLKKLLGINDDEVISYFSLQKYMNKHFNKANIKEL